MNPSDFSTLVQVAHGNLHDDPQSGSLLKLLGENGFKEKIESGYLKGHTYTIIHKPPSTEFLLVDRWHDGASEHKKYHAFTIKPSSTPAAVEPEHPLVTYLQQLHRDADAILTLIKKYA